MRPLVLFTVLVGSLAGAGDAAAAVVLIKPDGPDPERARVAPGFDVRWENLTSTPQRVESVGQPDFEAVNVPANGAGERRFNRVGRYRYKLSATGQEGVVIVGAVVRPRAQGHGCSRRDVFRYDVTVTGGKSAKEQWLPQYERNGVFSFSYRFAVRYPAALTVSHDCSGGITVKTKQTGSGSLKNYEWSDGVVSSDPQNHDWRPCGFSAGAEDLTATIDLRADLSRQGPWSISMDSFLVPSQADAVYDLLNAKRDAVCDKGNLTNFRAFDDLPGHGFVPIFENPYRIGPFRLNPPQLNMPAVFGKSGLRNPPQAVRALASGRGFTLDSRIRRYEGTGSQTFAAADASVKVTFARRR